MDETRLKELLEQFGYSLVFREDDWTRCVVAKQSAQEQWLGKGIDEEGALQDAVRQMFPSGLALDLLKAALEPADEPVEIPEPVVAIEKVEPPKPEPPKRQRIPVYAGTQAYVDPSIKAEAAAEAKEQEEKITKEEALEIVQGIVDEITDGLDELAVTATSNQKLQIAAWIFRGRAVQEQFPRDLEIEEAVHAIALRLTEICKVFWPGSVRALQFHVSPTHSLEGLVRTSKRVRKWADVAELVAEQMEKNEARREYDEYGWCDYALLEPKPRSSPAILREAVAKIEEVVGELGGPLDEKSDQVPGEKVLAEMEELIMAAHLLRWIRRSVSDRTRWGYAMGALRWASRQTKEGAEDLREVIGDDYRPRKCWAELLGRDPKVNYENRTRKQLMKRLPELGWPEEELMEWLHKAFPVFTNPQIAKMTKGVHDQIMRLTNVDFADADRNTRTRLRKLQSIFRNQEDVSEVELPSDEELVEIEEDKEAISEPTVSTDPTDALLEGVQKITAGKHILFVSNREDPRLQKDLERNLKCKVTLKDGGNPRLMKAIIKSVDKTRYDFVLMATGFNKHSADTALCRTAKAQGLPYIRVQKGRVAATVRALDRVFNLTGQRKEADEAGVAQTN